MQEDIRKKVFLDVFVSKTTLLPIVVGGTVSMLSWAVDAWVPAFLGFSAGVFGVGVFITRFVFNLEKVTENAFNYLQEQKKAELEDSLSKLEEELPPKERDILISLKESYKTHKERVQNGTISTSDELETKLDNLFNACVEQLKYANELSNTADTLTKDSRQNVLASRKRVLAEINDSVKCFDDIIEGICSINTEKSTKSLSDLRNELKVSFEVKKKVEARVAELDKKE